MHYRIVEDLPLKIGDTFEFNGKFFEVCPHEEGLDFVIIVIFSRVVINHALPCVAHV